MDVNHIKKVANSLSKLIHDNEKISLHAFAAKLSEASDAYPEDRTIGVMGDIVERMSGNKSFITRAEVKDLYTRLFSRNTKFAELFKDELGQTEELTSAKIYNREGNDENHSILNKAYEQIVDPTLANALNASFGNVSKTYTATNADMVKQVCAKAFGKIPANITIVNGNESFIVCNASIDTPKGKTFLFVPIEIVADKALLPSIFIGNAGPEDFSTSNVQKYVVANAGKKLTISEKVVMAAISNVKASDISKISNVDLALISLNAGKETKADYFANSVLFQKVASENPNLVVQVPTLKDEEVDSFAEQFNSAAGVAKFQFGAEKVSIGKNVIANKLNQFGLKNYQISLYNTDASEMTFAVSLGGGKVAFCVPVKVSKNNVFEPTILISNGSIEKFSKEGITSLFDNDVSDFRTAALASPLYGQKASELVETVRVAMAKEDYVGAEEALNVLSELGDERAYKSAFAAFTSKLSGKKEAEVKSCTMVVKNASSQHSLCGHTGLPLHKVYQDKQGNCRPVYRKGMEDSYEGAYFQNSKIFF